MCTKSGVDRSSRFVYRARINRQTDKQNRQTPLNVLPTPAATQPVTYFLYVVGQVVDCVVLQNVYINLPYIMAAEQLA